MPGFKAILNDGYAVIIYPNALGSTTLAVISEIEWPKFQKAVEPIPEDRVIDIRGNSAEAVIAGAEQLVRKMRREGEYEGWDEKMNELGLADLLTEKDLPHDE